MAWKKAENVRHSPVTILHGGGACHGKKLQDTAKRTQRRECSSADPTRNASGPCARRNQTHAHLYTKDVDDWTMKRALKKNTILSPNI